VDVRVWINKYFSSRMSCVFPSISDDFWFQNLWMYFLPHYWFLSEISCIHNLFQKGNRALRFLWNKEIMKSNFEYIFLIEKYWWATFNFWFQWMMIVSALWWINWTHHIKTLQLLYTPTLCHCCGWGCGKRGFSTGHRMD
jgi:hypothetical protein